MSAPSFAGAALVGLALFAGGGAKGSRGAEAPASVATLTLSPQAVTLPNPTAPGGRGTPRPRISVALTALNAQGQPITSGTFTQPVRLHVYGPPAHVLEALTPVVRSPKSTVYFRYTGGYLANSIVATAVSGHAFALMSFQPKHRGFAGKKSVTFRIPNTNNRNFARGWGFTASIGGGPAHYVQMDTGSRGVVVPAAVLGPKAVGPGPPGQIEYTSSGKIFLGHYYLTPLKLRAGGASVTTVPMQVLGVEKAACDPAYPKCVVGTIAGLGLIGVGFDRGTSGSAPPELTNGFLALTGVIQGSMHPGYVVTADSVTLGITPAGQSGYSRIKLQPGGTGPGDWDTEPGCFGFPGIPGYASICGTMLVDTGINSAILALPRSQRPPSIASTIPNGVSIRFAAPNTVSPVASYTFKTGGGPPAPTSVRWAGGSAPFVNTGRNLIAQFDYLFDDGSGRVGFKAVTR